MIPNAILFPDSIKLRITREDLKKNFFYSFECPIATALNRHFKSVWPLPYERVGVDVTYYNAYVWRRPDDNVIQRSCPMYGYDIRRADVLKVKRRAGGSLWGRIMGGCNIEIHLRKGIVHKYWF